MSAPAILEVHAIALSYGGLIPALRKVTLTVPQGAIVALLGCERSGQDARRSRRFPRLSVPIAGR